MRAVKLTRRSHGREVERNGNQTVVVRNQRGEVFEYLARALTSQLHKDVANSE